MQVAFQPLLVLNVEALNKCRTLLALFYSPLRSD